MTPPPLELPTSRLPFGDDDFSWERFEQFCLGLVRRLPNVREVYRYGKAGENQRGIDIVAEHDDGTKSTYQCRRRKTFGPRSAEKTVGDTSYEAEHHFIVVTCTVSRDTRDYVDGLADWTLWDIDEISDEVRKLPREEGRRLVEDTFGTAVRRVFLGPEGTLVFEAPGDHFAEAVVGFLLRRVEAGNGELDFRALPLDGFPVDVLDGADETTRENLLRRVRDRYDPSLSSEIEISTAFLVSRGGPDGLGAPRGARVDRQRGSRARHPRGRAAGRFEPRRVPDAFSPGVRSRRS